jgi:hypothetical protein
MSETRKKCFDSLKNTKFNVILVTQDNIDTDYLRTYFMNFHG